MEEATKTVSELVEKYAEEIATAIRDAAPSIWRACLLEAWGGYVVGTILLTGSAVICLATAAWCRRVRRSLGDDTYRANEWDGWAAFANIIAAACVVGAVSVLAAGFYHAPFAAVANVAYLVKP